MKEYRKTREKIIKENPRLLKRTRSRINCDAFHMPLSAKLSQGEEGMEPIDREKNMNTINKMLELTPPSAEFQRQLKRMLVELSA